MCKTILSFAADSMEVPHITDEENQSCAENECGTSSTELANDLWELLDSTPEDELLESPDAHTSNHGNPIRRP